MSDEPTNFKVTDRRLFNSDGTPRDVAPEEQPAPQPATQAATPSAPIVEPESQPANAATQPTQTEATAPSQSGVDDDELLDAEDPAGFINFVMSIASNAASSLGMMEHPVTHKREVDLELAKHWIDVLGMLQTKTRNNLLPQEEKILEGLLADLRMQYVSLTNSTATNAPSAYTGRDIVGG